MELANLIWHMEESLRRDVSPLAEIREPSFYSQLGNHCSHVHAPDFVGPYIFRRLVYSTTLCQLQTLYKID